MVKFIMKERPLNFLSILKRDLKVSIKNRKGQTLDLED